MEDGLALPFQHGDRALRHGRAGIILDMKVPFPPGSLLYAMVGLVGVCVAALGAAAGFLVGSWWGTAPGFVVGGCLFLGSVRTTLTLCGVHAREVLHSTTEGSTEEKAAAQMVLRTATLYEAAVFPLTPGGVSAEERRTRRIAAYHFAAHDSLPRSVRVAAAAALEAIDEGLEAKHARAEIWALNWTVLECHRDRVHLHDDQTP
ncbi:hypothetical protein [Streptomyces sp. LN704]|uniref:hypothetical protein n=1 Tax=Streptomyces sp. LN704 TaxID=3112982 RepID=UPI0037183CBE